MTTTEPPQVSPKEKLTQDLTQNLGLIEKAVSTNEIRFFVRVLRNTPSIRKRIDSSFLHQQIATHFPKGHQTRELLLNALPKDDTMEVDEGKEVKESNEKTEKVFLAEIEVYFSLLCLMFLLDQNKVEQALQLSTKIVDRVHQLNKRTLDQFSAKIFFYYARCYELSNRLSEIRGLLLNMLRTTTLHQDEECQATIINLLLRNYLESNLIEQADKLVSKTTFPESAGNSQIARYHYYVGKIKAIQLEYSESHKRLVEAIRKGPQVSQTQDQDQNKSSPQGAGFQQAVHKLAIIVQLLMGEIPERGIFRMNILKKPLAPYLKIAQAVRSGDLPMFKETMNTYAQKFIQDKMYTLILRLRHNVIKTGVRMISLSYSRISFKDICHKLHLDSAEDAEFIVSKAIRDGVIDASIDHQNGYMKSKEVIDVYSTNEPQLAFHQRISFCLNLHNESVKAMRFPPNAHKKMLEIDEETRERDQQEKELAKELADEDDDDVF